MSATELADSIAVAILEQQPANPVQFQVAQPDNMHKQQQIHSKCFDMYEFELFYNTKILVIASVKLTSIQENIDCML